MAKLWEALMSDGSVENHDFTGNPLSVRELRVANIIMRDKEAYFLLFRASAVLGQQPRVESVEFGFLDAGAISRFRLTPGKELTKDDMEIVLTAGDIPETAWKRGVA